MLYLVRHAKAGDRTAWKGDDRLRPLSKEGRRQADSLARKLARLTTGQIVSSPYEVDGKVVGTLGVIGPTRMAYDRMIQIVDITSKLVSNALSHNK